MKAVLVDFGGVLTTSVHEAFERFGAELGDPGLPMRLLRDDPESAQLIVEAESGRMEDEEFEARFAARLAAHGAEVEADDLIRRMQAGMAADDEMLALISGLRAAGHPVALVTNSFGRHCYDGLRPRCARGRRRGVGAHRRAQAVAADLPGGPGRARRAR